MPAGLPGLQSDALAGYHFAIEIDGVAIAQFQEVSGITLEVDVIDLKENTKDGKFVLHKVPGNHKTPTIVLKRGKNASMDLFQWYQDVITGKIDKARKNGSIVLMGYDHQEVSRYNFVNAWPSKITTSALKAGANEIVTEEVTIVCEDLERVK